MRNHSVGVATLTMLQGISELVSTRDRVYRTKAQAYGRRQKARQDFVAARDYSHWWVATRTFESEVTGSKSIHNRIFERTVRQLVIARLYTNDVIIMTFHNTEANGK